MTQINTCEFMIKGYHYTKPTTPSRTDSCRLYLDTSISGEESSVVTGDYNAIPTETIFGDKWVVPETAYMDSNIPTLCHLKGFHNFYVKN